MRHLFDGWNDIEKELDKKHILLLLDYDGTLAPIAESPEKAVISDETKESLRSLARLNGIQLAIVSGRPLGSIKKMIGIEDIIYVGNHGLEIEGPKIKFVSPVSGKFRMILEEIKEMLGSKLSGIKGALVEDKGLSLSVHYRLANRKFIPSTKEIIREAAVGYLAKNKIKIRPGKKVIEIGPPVSWDKGKVALWLLARQMFWFKGHILPIYAGDDTSDEDAFKALRKRGVTIFVGRPKKTYAEYYLKDSNEVLEMLIRINELLSKR